jgi:hypothetical protein
MPVRPLPSNPSLDHLKDQAKDLLKGHAARDFEGAQRIREFHPSFMGAGDAEIFSARFGLADAQLAIAREYGFPSWTRLKARVEKPTPSDQSKLPHHERIEDALFRRAVHLLDTGDTAGLRTHLKQQQFARLTASATEVRFSRPASKVMSIRVSSPQTMWLYRVSSVSGDRCKSAGHANVSRVTALMLCIRARL